MLKFSTSEIRMRAPRLSAGFTLAEVLIASGLLAVLIVGSVVTLTQLNRSATASRLRSIALAVAQQRLDQIMITPWQVTGTAPAILTPGTTTETNVPLNNDNYNASTSLISPYTSLDSQVLATRTTVVTAVTSTTLRASVTVTYTYRNRQCSFTLNSLRATDSI
jgi:Tfp pilus assembly protein PilV